MSESVEVIQVIHTRLERRGDGKETYIRIVDQYWNMQGELMWEVDPLYGDDKVKAGGVFDLNSSAVVEGKI